MMQGFFHCNLLVNKFHHRKNLIAVFSAILYNKDNGVFRNLEIFSPKGTSHTNSDSEWENESFIQVISP
jgi:hypothetical protein